MIIVAVLGISAMVALQGCSEEETLTPQEFAPPSNFRALSQSGVVVLYWTRSSSDGGSDFAGYRVKTFFGTAMIDSFQTTLDTARISGLTNGQNYKFKIWSVKDNGDVSIADSIMWGPTVRYGAVPIWEFESANPSGLNLATGAVYSFAIANVSNIDLWLDGRSGVDLLLKSPSDEDFASTGWKETKLYETSATSLDQQVNFPAIGSYRSSPGLPIVVGKVYLAILADGSYARFRVTAATLTGAPNRSVSIEIAYNTGTGTWAKK